MPRTLKLAAIGTAGGLFSGLLGVGGGSVIVPLLIVWLGYGAREATGTSMMAIVVIAAVAVTLQAFYGNVDPPNAALVGIPAIGGAIVGTALQQRIPDSAALRWPPRHHRREADPLVSSIAAAIMGFAGGMVGGLLGVGGGILFVPALAIFMGETQVRAEATSLLAIVPVALVAVWRQLGYGNVRVREGLVIGALSPIGVGVGVVASNAIPQRALELTFAGLALLIAAQLVIRAFREPAGPSPDYSD